MGCLYFCQTHSKGQRTLRAVLMGDECLQLLGPDGAGKLGAPSAAIPDGDGAAEDFAVLSVEAGDAGVGLKAGYYRLNQKLTQINEILQSLGK